MKPPIRVNIGCFDQSLPDWVNIDLALRHIVTARIPGLARVLAKLGLLSEAMLQAHLAGKFRRVRYGDMRRRLPFADGSVDCIYTSHALEHVSCQEAQGFLREACRVLRPGGLVRIAIPDMAKAARAYVQAIEGGTCRQEDTEALVSVFLTKERSEFRHGHRWMYDIATLSAALEDAGFEDVRQREYGIGDCPDAGLLDNRRDSLFVEARKLQAGGGATGRMQCV